MIAPASDLVQYIVLSFRHRNSVASALASDHADVVVTRRVDSAEKYVTADVPTCIFIDARDAVIEGLAAAERLLQPMCDAVRLIAIVSPIDDEYAAAFTSIGAADVCTFSDDPDDSADLAACIARYRPMSRGAAGVLRQPSTAIGEHAALILCEISDLAQQNDRFGRTHGDALLQAVQRRIDRTLRDENDPAAQCIVLSGARFAVLHSCASDAWLATMGAALRSQIGTAYSIGQQSVQPHVRISGARAKPKDGLPALARRAALAKPIRAQGTMVGLAASAIADHRITMLYQPQYCVADDRLYGAEALVRWRTADGADHGAAALVAAAQAESILPALGVHIWDRVMDDLNARHEASAAHHISVNISAQELADANFAKHLLARLRRGAINPTRITVEVTEHSLIDGKSAAHAQLAALRSVGMRVALDDFGTGFSSLAYLKDLPVDAIKIDSGFSRDAVGSARDRSILAAIVGLARSLDLAVVAEGVESEAQLMLLRDMGCTYYQGFLRARPLSAAAFFTL